MKKILFLMFVLAVANSTVASAQKIGRVLFQEIVLVLPEADSIQLKIQKQAEQHEADLEQMRVELNNKVEDYQKNKANYSPAIDEQKQKELAEYNARYQEFAQTASRDIENTQFSLTQPLFNKVSATISEVAKEQGLVMVVDLTQGNNIMYIDEVNTTDITPLVKEKLGVARDAKPAMPQQQAPMQ